MEGITYGDLFSSLSQIGIITDTDESSPTFGLLVINTETKDSSGNNVVQSTATMTFKEALAKDPEAVAKLFAAKNEARSNSPDFGENSIVASITEPGTYDVSYTTDSSGNIASATINGKEAKIQGTTISLTRTPESSDSGVATVASFNGLADRVMEMDIQQLATRSTTTIQAGLADRTDAINTGADPVDFSYEYNGVTRTFEIAPDSTLNDLVSGINADSANPGVSARIAASGEEPPRYNLVLEAKETGANPVISVTLPGGGALATAPATEEAGVNARYKAWASGTAEPAGYTESGTNDVAVAAGLTVSLQGTGTATIKALQYNDADGTVLDIYNLAPDSTMEGTFSLRQGKVNELLDMLGGTEGILGSSGTLAILENNYDDIIANIEDKITKEDERLQKWLRTTKLRFSRLETTLSNYQNLQASIESQIKQLNSGSS